MTTLTYDSAGNLIAVETADQSRVAFNYDAQHHLVQKRDARGQTYAYQFDAVGRLKRATLPTGDSRELRPTELTGVPDLANGQGVPGNPAPLSQPPVVQATFKDAKGQTTTFETDAIGRVTKQIDPLTRTTLIERDPQGNPTKITRPNGAITTMTYDAKGNLLTSTEQAIAPRPRSFTNRRSTRSRGLQIPKAIRPLSPTMRRGTPSRSPTRIIRSRASSTIRKAC